MEVAAWTALRMSNQEERAQKCWRRMMGLRTLQALISPGVVHSEPHRNSHFLACLGSD